MSKLTYPSQEIRSIEKKTFALHITSQLLNGISMGILLLFDIILKKSLTASDFQVTILIFLTSSAFLFSIYGAEIINRSNNQARTIIIMGLCSRVFLFIIPFFESPNFFIFCIAAMSYIDSMIKPAWNVVYKHNYTEQKRSSLYSYASSINIATVLVITAIVGYMLDIDYRYYKILYPVAGIVDIITFFYLAKLIKMRASEHTVDNKFTGGISLKLMKDIVILPVRNMMRIFRENKPFKRFEVYFFYYGMALMIASPAIPIFLVDYLHLDYSPISLAKGLLFHSAMILFTPIMGKIHGVGNPARFCGYLFLWLMLFPGLLVAIEYFALGEIVTTDILLYITYFVFGIGMSGITIAWNLSSIYYAPPAQVSNYQAVHITLTGVRGIFSPFIGYAIMQIFSIQATFLVSALLFGAAGIMMLREHAGLKKRKINT